MVSVSYRRLSDALASLVCITRYPAVLTADLSIIVLYGAGAIYDPNKIMQTVRVVFRTNA